MAGTAKRKLQVFFPIVLLILGEHSSRAREVIENRGTTVQPGTAGPAAQPALPAGIALRTEHAVEIASIADITQRGEVDIAPDSESNGLIVGVKGEVMVREDRACPFCFDTIRIAPNLRVPTSVFTERDIDYMMKLVSVEQGRIIPHAKRGGIGPDGRQSIVLNSLEVYCRFRVAINAATTEFIRSGSQGATLTKAGKGVRLLAGSASLFGRPTTTAKGPTIRIGAIVSMTGPGTMLGGPEARTLEMLVQEANEKGGIGGRPIELVLRDSGANPEKAISFAKELIEEYKVFAIIGPSTSGETLKIKDIAEEGKTILLSCAAADAIVNPVARYVFKVAPSDSYAAPRIFEQMKKMGISKIGLLSNNSGFGKAGKEQVEKLAPSFGIQIVASEVYESDATDFTALLTKLKAARVQAFINWSVGPEQAIVIKNARQLGLSVPIFQSQGFGNIQYVKAAGLAAEGVLFPASRLLATDSLPSDDRQKPVLLKYKKSYEARYREGASIFGGYAHDALLLLAEAVEKAGTVDTEKVRATLETLQGVAGTAGVFSFSERDHGGLGIDAFVMQTVKNGAFLMAREAEGVAKKITQIVAPSPRACDAGDAIGCENARQAYQQACDGGDVKGCELLGSLYEAGKGIARDIARAAQLYERACEGGHAPACMALGVLYSRGDGVAKNPRRAVQLFKRACDSGHVKGCRNLGTMYAHGDGVVQDDSRAVQLFKQACDGGNALSCSYLGVMYAEGGGVERDLARAAQLHKQACDGGSADGCAQLGDMYHQAKGVAKDLARAAQLFKQACDGGHAGGCGGLGFAYLQGEGVAKDLSRAAQLFKQACDGGDAGSCANLGTMYAEGKNVAEDEFAVQLFKQACDGGDRVGCKKLGAMYARGKGVGKDPARAAKLFSQACQSGDAEGCRMLGIMRAEGIGVAKDSVHAAQLARQACNGGDVSGCRVLGLAYEDGEGVAKDTARAAQLFEQACDGGDASGCMDLGRMCANGEGVAKNLERAAQLVKRACDGRDPRGCGALATLYLTGQMQTPGNSVADNLAHAVQLFAYACDHGDASSCGNLGMMYADGKGVPKDIVHAKRLFKQACDRGSTSHCTRDVQ
jgi:branched-chain amino acid transport system substrate-binding protein